MNALKLDRRILAAKLKLLLFFITDITMKGKNKTTVKSIRSTLKVLPYYICSGNLVEIHGQFNNSVSTTCKTKKELDKLFSLYALDLVSLNTNLDHNLNLADYSANRIISRYVSPHIFKEMKTKLSKDETISGFSVFHNNVVNLNRNQENLQTQLLHGVDFEIFYCYSTISTSSELLKQKSPMLIQKCAQHIHLATYLNTFQRLWCLGA